MSQTRAVADAWTASVARMIVRLALYAALLAGLFYVLARLKSVITTIFVAMILAYIIRPLANWLLGCRVFRGIHNAVAAPVLAFVPERRRPRFGVPLHVLRVAASLYVLVGLCAIGWYSGKFLISPFTTEIRNVQENWAEYRAMLKREVNRLEDWYRRQIKPEYRRWIESQFRSATSDGSVREGAAAWLGVGISRSGQYVLFVVELVLIPVLAFYFAVDSRNLKHDFVALLPRRRRREMLRLIHDFNEIMFSFVVCQAVLCLIAGVVVGVGLAALGVPYPVSLGVLAGLTRAIPIIGPIFAGIPIVLLALVTRGMAVAAGVLVFFSILHFVESKFILPLLVGDRLDLHPVVIIVVLLIGEEFGGLLGMFFAAPVAALVRVALLRYWLPRAERRSAEAVQS